MKYINNIQLSFSIKDLELLSGVKAHTLRVWETRYGIFSPSRSAGNQRIYNTEDLKRLLSIVLLYDQGHRISQISTLDNAQCLSLAEAKMKAENSFHSSARMLEISMLGLNPSGLDDYYEELRGRFDVSTIYFEVFVPLLNKIGRLWHGNALSPVHEHFFSAWLIKQLTLETQLLDTPSTSGPMFILFLPEGEFHEIGLHFFQYQLKLQGHQTIYLGSSLSMIDLKPLSQQFPDAVFACHLTMARSAKEIESYCAEFCTEVLHDDSQLLLLVGKSLKPKEKNLLSPQVTYLSTLDELEQKLKGITHV